MGCKTLLLYYVTPQLVHLASMNQLNDWISWGERQLLYVFYIIVIAILVYLAFKRAWIWLVGTVITFSIIAIFVNDPLALIELSQWFAKLLSREPVPRELQIPH